MSGDLDEFPTDESICEKNSFYTRIPAYNRHRAIQLYSPYIGTLNNQK